MSIRLDVTAEQLHSLSDETENLLDELPDNKPVLIQAFISKEVPQAYAQTRSNLLGFLKEIDAEAGGKVQVLIHDTEPYTEESKDAREKFGITPREIPNVTSATASVAQVFMGVAFTSGAEEEVITFFDRGLPVEYELTRSIRTVVKSERKKIGIINTKVKLFGGFDYQTMQSSPSWPVVEELKKQYDVVQISADKPIIEEMDALLAVLPSSLSQPEMDNLKNYIDAGNPTLLLVDPLPVVDISLAPSEKAGAQSNPFQQQRGPKPEPKGNIQKLMSELGVAWNSASINWDGYNPHPDLAQIQPEIIFVGEGNENPNAFGRENIVSSGLQELVLLYPGNIQQTGGKFEFEPLLQSSKVSGALQYQQIVRRSFFGT
ncbi:MAG: GldG family protein, partial [Calditrichia bacterium]|nr:GldG family protein [Calditrichia bacterium]